MHLLQWRDWINDKICLTTTKNIQYSHCTFFWHDNITRGVCAVWGEEGGEPRCQSLQLWVSGAAASSAAISVLLPSCHGHWLISFVRRHQLCSHWPCQDSSKYLGVIFFFNGSWVEKSFLIIQFINL